MTNPPSGTVTFLFTDIEGSTQLARQHPDTMPAALARHHAILNEAIEDNEGYLFRTLGDEFEVAFATAQQALAAVLTAQRELQRADWCATGPLRVRMGLHTGPAVPRGDDYDGYLTLAHTKRLMAVAVGEQVLVSQAAHALLYEQLPPGITLQDLGAHRLKDFDRAENIYQVRAPDAGLWRQRPAALLRHRQEPEHRQDSVPAVQLGVLGLRHRQHAPAAQVPAADQVTDGVAVDTQHAGDLDDFQQAFCPGCASRSWFLGA